jgi:hypothetical protein
MTEALLFLSHFMGDIHQPMHVGFTSDEGGNTIDLRWYKHKSNLHHVWDREIILTALKENYDKNLDLLQEDLEKNITNVIDTNLFIFYYNFKNLYNGYHILGIMARRSIFVDRMQRSYRLSTQVCFREYKVSL